MKLYNEKIFKRSTKENIFQNSYKIDYKTTEQ